MENLQDIVIKILQKTTFTRKEVLVLSSRESDVLEYKEMFDIQIFKDCLKTIAGFANNKGGMFLFGIKNSPHLPIGMQDNKFENLDTATIQSIIQNALSGNIGFEIETIEYDNKKFGALKISESENKPIIVRKESGKIKEGEIYFRYRGQTKLILYEDLARIIEENKIKHIKKWFDFVKKADVVGIENAEIFDIKNGMLSMGKKNILLDEKMLKSLVCIREGEFDEVKGAPAIKIIGEIEGFANVIATKKITQDLVRDYPYIRKTLLETLDRKMKGSHFEALLWKYNFKNDKEYSTPVPQGATTPYRYSQAALDKLKNEIDKQGKDKTNWLIQITREHARAKKNK